MTADGGTVVELGGGEAVTILERGGAVLAFGAGPRFGGAARAERARRVAAAAGAGVHAVRWCDQVHGTLVATLSEEPGRALEGAAAVGRCDGLMTAEPGLAVGVWTADCVPVLLAGGGVVAALHSGWRGTAAGIVPRAVRRLLVEYGVAPGDLHAALGPAIGGCCYEVGGEVIEALGRRGVGESVWRRGSRVDLRALLAAELAALGVPSGRIERVGGCTACSGTLASYRRDGAASGRQLSLAVLPADSEPGTAGCGV